MLKISTEAVTDRQSVKIITYRTVCLTSYKLREIPTDRQSVEISTEATTDRQSVEIITEPSATHVSWAILAIITYVRVSYFKGTSKFLKYFGSTLEVRKYF
jgi:hypothetical protein